ncbi:MAG: hypothetical protein A2039_09945 [Candidatus Melainabacteria bacterium GWA2_34_9]|nr:MAG: hypothetical protein A2039_09945 [Candidatus Melainabacteria bacterium GWA2_34_9]
MGDVNLNETRYYCTPSTKLKQTNQSSPIQQQSKSKEVFENNNIPEGYDLVLVKRNDNAENVSKNEPSADTNQSVNTNVNDNPASNNFLNLTMPESLDMFNTSDIAVMVNNLNRQPAPALGAAQSANNAASAPVNNIYDIAFQKAVEKLTKKLDEGKITEKEFISQLKDIKKQIKESASQEVKEDEADVEEQRDEKLSAPQKEAINEFLSGSDNKTFIRDDFQKDPEISGAQTASQNIGKIARNIKVLNDGTTVEITEDKGQKGFWGTVKRVCTAWQTNNIYTAIITRPDGSKQTIKANSPENIDKQVYKSIGILK